MPRLEVEIGGSTSGLGRAANQALGIIQNLQNVASELKLDLFKATDVTSLNAIGNTLTNVTGQIRTYTEAAIQGSKAFKDQQTAAILDTLNTKMTVLTGNAQIFGESVKNQKAQVTAYEAAISRLLANGLTPLDSRVTALKSNIDTLNASIAANVTAAANAARSAQNLGAQYQATGSLILDAEAKVKRLRTALSGATDERSIIQYNVRLRAAQVELDRLRNLGVVTGTTLTNSANAAANATRRLSGGYNAVGLEFGRIIQDAPFAANNIGAIGNNITRLVEVIPGYVAQQRAMILANGGIATSSNVARASLAGMLTGFGGVTIAISAIVAAGVFYQQYTQRQKRAQDELTGANKEYIDTLKGVDKAQLSGIKNAQSDLVTMKLLFAAYQDANIPLKERKSAYEQLQQLYPEYFKNISFEKTASERTKKAYDELTGSIIATSKARAAANIITKNAERGFDNESKAAKIQIEIDKKRIQLSQTLTKIRKDSERGGLAAGSAGVGAAQGIGENEIKRRGEEEINKLISQRNNINTDTNLLNKENLELQRKVNAEIAKRGTLVDLNNKKDIKAKKGLKDTLTPKVERSTDLADLAGLEGVDILVEKVRQRYAKLYDDINTAAAVKGANLNKIRGLQAQVQINEAKEISQIIIAENARVAEEIQRINNDSGVKASETRAKDFAQIEKWYDLEVQKAAGNAEILVAIENGKQAQIAAISEKYHQKFLAEEEKVNVKIATLADKTFKTNDRNTVRGSRLIDEELAKRLKANEEYFAKLKKLYEGDPMAQAVLGLSQTAVATKLTGDAQAAKDGGIGKELSRSVAKFGTDMFATLSSINTMADKSFGNVVATIGENLSKTLNDIFSNQLQKMLTSVFDELFKNISAKNQGLSLGLGVAGALVSGVSKKTSSLGQAAGGALTGAGIGTAILPGIGTAVGAALGAIGGLLGAGKARKEEERIMKEQLAEAKRQTEILRQNALAYTSAIVGRMTNQGILTAVDVNGFGELKATVSGKQIDFVLSREKNTR